ncbi:ferredoxin-NADP reductase [Pedobacter sp. UYEF25]
MAKYKVSVLSIVKVTHDVLQIKTDKPSEFKFIPGQATEIFLDKLGWEDEGRPFTFTSLPTDDYLEFTIKTYPKHKGVTNELLKLKTREHLFVNDVFGDIAYKEEGIFIAGGAGITPFVAIFKALSANNLIGNNKLIFANRTKADVIYEDLFRKMLGTNFINVLSTDHEDGYEHGYITANLLKKHIDGSVKYHYLCGPPPMIDAVEKILDGLNIEGSLIIKEAY